MYGGGGEGGGYFNLRSLDLQWKTQPYTHLPTVTILYLCIGHERDQGIGPTCCQSYPEGRGRVAEDEWLGSLLVPLGSLQLNTSAVDQSQTKVNRMADISDKRDAVLESLIILIQDNIRIIL